MKLMLNGRLVDAAEATVSVYDHGFLYGLGCFETFRTYAGRPFLLKDHLARLQAGCEELGIQVRLTEQKINSWIGMLLQANDLDDAYIRYSISAGPDILGLSTQGYKAPTEIVYIKELPKRDEALYREGRELQLLQLRRNSPEGAVRLKSFHYMNNVLGKREMNEYPWATHAEGLFLDRDGYVSEGIVSNIFFVREGCLYTPSTQTGLLPGITRRFVINEALEAGQQVEEGKYRLDELCWADEIFLTNSVQEIVPVRCIYNGLREVIWRAPEGCGYWTNHWLHHYRKEAQGGR